MKKLILLLVSSMLLGLTGCSVFPFHSEPPKQTLPYKTNVNVDPVIRDNTGKEILATDESIIKYAVDSLKSCDSDCNKEVNVNIRFVANTNSNTTFFKVWKWLGIVTLGIVPVDEITKFTLVADVKSPTGIQEIKKEINRHLVFSIFLLPMNIFRDWQKDYWGAQKILIDQLALELSQ